MMDNLNKKDNLAKDLYKKGSISLRKSYLKNLKKNALIGVGVGIGSGLGVNELIKRSNRKKNNEK